MSYIEIKGIRKSFGENQILRNVSLSVKKGEFVTFLGPSGCGKTTLLRCLVGLEKSDEGSIFLDGKDITKTPANKRGIHMIFQQYCLFPTMNLFDNVSFGLRMQSIPRETVRKSVHHVLDMVGLLGHEKKYAYQLSGGEQQRAALARCLIMNPKVLLLDEPFSAIDAKLRKELQLYLKRIHREMNMTSIFVTHDQEEAMRISDTIHLFNNGVLEQSGKPRDIYAQPQTAFVAGFIGNYNKIKGPDFNRMVKSGHANDHLLAVRPELIQMAASPYDNEHGFYYAEGRIQDYIPQGNVIRYAVRVNGTTINVDAIFNSELNWQRNQDIFLRIKKEDVLSFASKEKE